jgi:two-component system chemotaxis response regulator CheY
MCYEMMEPDPNMKVLVVDDSLVMRRIIINHLRALGYSNILEADNGKKALRILEEEQVDLIFSDWCMQVMHGIEVLRNVRKNEATKDIPFIMVTAEAQPHLILEAIRAQVSDYVVKPFTRDTLRESIEKVLALGKVGG